MPTTDTSHVPTPRRQDLIGPVWRRKWLLVAIVVLATAGTYVVSAGRADRFRSSTRVLISDSQIATIVSGFQQQSSDRDTLDQATLVLSRRVTQAVISRLRLRDTPSELQGTVTASPVTGSNFVLITAERGSAAEAAAVANAYVAEYIRVRSAQLTAEAAGAITRIRAQLSSLPIRTSTLQQRQDLSQTIRQLRVTSATVGSQSRQPDPAVAATAPFSPKPKRDAAFALAIALALGLALVYALERLDRRIKSVEDVSEAYGLALISSIPHTANPADVHEGHAVVPEALREPVRSLRANLHLASLDRPIRCLVVASAVSGEGKSTIVRTLALTYREWGLSVVVLEADLRRPTLTASFGADARKAGLTSVLTGDCTLEDALIPIDFDTASLDYLDKVRVGGDGKPVPGGWLGKPSSPTETEFMLLPSGDAPPNPQAVLAAEKMRQVVGLLSHRFDVVLVDTPPLLAVSDALPLLPQADGVILVTRVGMTTTPAAARVVALVQRDPSVNLLGVVANDVSSQPGGGYLYGYGYGQGYDQAYGSSNGHKSKSKSS